MKQQPIEIKEQSIGINSSLPRNLDGEAGKFVDTNDTDDCTVVDLDEDVEAPHFTQVLQNRKVIASSNKF
jgi:uncharacterized protein YuzE